MFEVLLRHRVRPSHQECRMYLPLHLSPLLSTDQCRNGRLRPRSSRKRSIDPCRIDIRTRANNRLHPFSRVKRSPCSHRIRHELQEVKAVVRLLLPCRVKLARPLLVAVRQRPGEGRNLRRTSMLSRVSRQSAPTRTLRNCTEVSSRLDKGKSTTKAASETRISDDLARR